jgi:hypothetical protein
MVELDVIEELKPDSNVLKVIGESKPTMIKVSNGKVNQIKRTNIKSIEPIIYELTFKNEILIIWQYPIAEIEGNKFYIPDTKNTYSLPEIRKLLTNY